MRTLLLRVFFLVGQSAAFPGRKESAISFYEYQQQQEQHEQYLKDLKQSTIIAEQKIENFGHIQPIYIYPGYIAKNAYGYGFKVQFKTGTLDVFLYESDVTDNGYLLISGPDNFNFGYKWFTTRNYAGYQESCTKEIRSSLSKILDMIADVKIKPRFGETKTDWINGGADFHTCIPDLNFKLKTDEEFVSEAFNGLGMHITKKEIEKIESFKLAYQAYCQTNTRRNNC